MRDCSGGGGLVASIQEVAMMRRRRLILTHRQSKGKGRKESTISFSFGDLDEDVAISYGDPEHGYTHKLDYDDVATVVSFLQSYMRLHDELEDDDDDEDEDEDKEDYGK